MTETLELIYRVLLIPFILIRITLVAIDLFLKIKHSLFVSAIASIDSDHRIAVQITNRGKKDLKIKHIDVVRDHSVWKHIIRKYLIGLRNFEQLVIIDVKHTFPNDYPLPKNGHVAKLTTGLNDDRVEFKNLEKMISMPIYVRIDFGDFTILEKIKPLNQGTFIDDSI